MSASEGVFHAAVASSGRLPTHRQARRAEPAQRIPPRAVREAANATVLGRRIEGWAEARNPSSASALRDGLRTSAHPTVPFGNLDSNDTAAVFDKLRPNGARRQDRRIGSARSHLQPLQLANRPGIPPCKRVDHSSPPYRRDNAPRRHNCRVRSRRSCTRTSGPRSSARTPVPTSGAIAT
jgi:hypothetical protein